MLRLYVNKSKFKIFRSKSNAKDACSSNPVFKIGGRTIEFVRQWTRQGHTLIDACI